MSSERDIVEEARNLAPYVQGMADPTGGGKLSAVPELLRALAGEVEVLRRGEFICKRCHLRKNAEFDDTEVNF